MLSYNWRLRLTYIGELCGIQGFLRILSTWVAAVCFAEKGDQVLEGIGRSWPSGWLRADRES
jgi:hypothetical protein